MIKLILLSVLFVGCASPGYKRHNMAVVKYTVREYYLPVKAVEPVKVVQSKAKPRKAVKKAKKVDCQRVFSLANSCMVK